jgi:DNA-binding response OmpR family regulator
MRVLIIDDEQPIAELIKDWLEERDFTISIAYNGAEGRKAIAEARPDAILLDAVLPDIKGTDLLIEIKSNPEVKDTRVIMISADDSIKDTLKLGADDFLIKPLSLPKLLEKLSR